MESSKKCKKSISTKTKSKKEEHSAAYIYLHKIIEGTKRSSIGNIDRVEGLLVNAIWEDGPIIIKNIMNTPVPEDVLVHYTIPYTEDYDLSLNVQIELVGKYPYNLASFYCALTPEVVKELKTHHLIHTVAGLRESDIDELIEGLTVRIIKNTEILSNLRSVKKTIANEV